MNRITKDLFVSGNSHFLQTVHIGEEFKGNEACKIYGDTYIKGILVEDGDFTDVRTKRNIQKYQNSIIEKFKNINVYTSGNSVCLLADEVENIFPLLINVAKHDNIDNCKYINYKQLIPYLVGANKEVICSVDNIKNNIDKKLNNVRNETQKNINEFREHMKNQFEAYGKQINEINAKQNKFIESKLDEMKIEFTNQIETYSKQIGEIRNMIKDTNERVKKSVNNEEIKQLKNQVVSLGNDMPDVEGIEKNLNELNEFSKKLDNFNIYDKINDLIDFKTKCFAQSE